MSRAGKNFMSLFLFTHLPENSDCYSSAQAPKTAHGTETHTNLSYNYEQKKLNLSLVDPPFSLLGKFSKASEGTSLDRNFHNFEALFLNISLFCITRILQLIGQILETKEPDHKVQFSSNI